MVGETLSLSEAIQSLRDELIDAQKAGEKSQVHFLIDDITLDLELVTSAKAKGKVKAKWWVLGADAGAEGSRARTHRVQLKMKLAPDSTGRDPRIGDEVDMD